MPVARIHALWRNVYDSLWFVPAVFTAGAIVVAALLIRADPLLPDAFDRREVAWLFSGGADGARGVLGAIAGSIITVTGVVFSVTIVALQLASSQYTPRVLRTFMADRPNQIVLGVFIATFVYAMFVMRSIRGSGEEYEAFVPAIATTFAVLLAIISIGFLIYYIHHAATSLQIETIMSRVARDTLRTIRTLYPENGVDADPGTEPNGVSHAVRSTASGYVTALDEGGLLEVARRTSCTIRIEVAVGEYVFHGSPLATVWADRIDEATIARARDAFATNAARTPHQDASLGIIELADIAIKALSPGINDPTTAMSAIDRLGELLLELGGRRRRTVVQSSDGATILLRLPTWDQTLRLAFDQIALFGATQPAVISHLAHTIGRIGALLPTGRRAGLRSQLARARITALDRLTLEMERAEVEAAVARAEAMLASAP